MTLSLVQTVTVGAGGITGITFSSIPQTATDLLLIVSGRSPSTGSYADGFNLAPNSASSGLSARRLNGDGSAASSGTGTSWFVRFGGGLATANTFGNAAIYIPNYTSSTAKSASIDAVTENNATNAIAQIQAASWTGTAAITSLFLDGDFVQYSTASLYTITKGSGGATVS